MNNKWKRHFGLCLVIFAPLILAGCQKSHTLTGKWHLTEGGKVVDIDKLASLHYPPVTREFNPDGTETVSDNYFRQDSSGNWQPAGWSTSERNYVIKGGTLIETSKDTTLNGKEIKKTASSTFTIVGDKLMLDQKSATGDGFELEDGPQNYIRE